MTNVLRTLRLLVEEHGFVPDHVTTNIVVKAALRWPTVLDAALVRRLFDYFVWSGYPGEEGVGMPIPMPKSKMSFVWHVKPLYKMFVKALYLRKDVAGARKVVGVLKEGERMEAERVAGKSRKRRARKV
ncbi:hypothetical protein BJV78DRAFT_808472 [Lactifluus subvellereus]|nr:hypothetical protein BJV78DRAFT_808472 [Lactifluus subvellereus]